MLAENRRSADGELGVSAETWYRSAPLRRQLAKFARPVTRLTLLRALGGEDSGDAFLMAAHLRALVGAGLVLEMVRRVKGGHGGQYFLGPESLNAAGWAGAPKPEDQPEMGFRSWAAEIARAIADLYGVSVHAMLRNGTWGRPVLARARLCAALYARGWPPTRIERYFAIPTGWAQNGIDRWREVGASRRAA